MRCRICTNVHKNTKRHEQWAENRICRVCGGLLEFFSLNHNILQEYWKISGGVKNGT